MDNSDTRVIKAPGIHTYTLAVLISYLKICSELKINMIFLTPDLIRRPLTDRNTQREANHN